jgi:hypothetical protein
MNLHQLIDVHLRQKLRLEQLLSARDIGRLDADHLERDDTCVIGQWIEAAPEAVRALPEFSDLRLIHSLLHVHIAKIVRNAQEARDDLSGQGSNSEFRSLSSDLVSLLGAIESKMTSGPQ